jgi:hypothetical protein
MSAGLRMAENAMRSSLLLVVLVLGCGSAGPWSSSSVELRLHTERVYDSLFGGTGGPPSPACAFPERR